jgi:ParB family transcriptional regulator, chromosome partitioning protein
MEIVNLPLEKLKSASWNSNQMDTETMKKLRESIRRYGVVENLVVRKLSEEAFEVLSGNQRLKLLTELGYSQVPCIVVDLNDAQARLLTQALNHLRGEDDLGLRAELMKEVLKSIPQAEVLAVLPDTAVSLESMNSLGQTEIADYLKKWEQAQAIKLKHMQFQLTRSQEELVEEALAQLMPTAKQNQGNNPNTRGIALYLLCKNYLEWRKKNGN